MLLYWKILDRRAAILEFEYIKFMHFMVNMFTLITECSVFTISIRGSSKICSACSLNAVIKYLWNKQTAILIIYNIYVYNVLNIILWGESDQFVLIPSLIMGIMPILAWSHIKFGFMLNRKYRIFARVLGL